LEQVRDLRGVEKLEIREPAARRCQACDSCAPVGVHRVRTVSLRVIALCRKFELSQAH
jgi:hypothetical protein